jgi:hypothetical protein
MARYSVAGGHTILLNGYSTSACGIHNELTQDRIIKDFVIEYLKLDGNEVFDATTPFSTVSSQSEDLAYKVNQVNQYNVDLAIDVHLNSADNVNASGVETYVHTFGNSSTEFATRVNNNLVSLGFQDRGVKENSGLAFLKNTNCKSILVECYFVSSQIDCNLADTIGLEMIGKAIASGMVGHEINKETPQPQEPSQPTLDMSRLPIDFNEQFYRYANPDVNQKIIEGVFPSGAYHYCMYGYADETPRVYKPTLPKDWNSKRYMELNSDIKQAVESKSIPSPSWHWLVAGWIENMANPNDRRYKYNDTPPIFYGDVPPEVVEQTEPIEEVKPVEVVEEVKTPIMGTPTATLEQAIEWAKSKEAPQEFIDLAPLYWKIWTERAGLNPVVGYVQCAKETGYCYKIPSQAGLNPSYHNPAGIKKTQGGGDYESSAHMVFDSWEQGITAHCDHIALYVGVEGYPRTDTPDPRHFDFIKGTAKYIEDLAGKYCPQSTYSDGIVTLKKELENTIVPEKIETPLEQPTENNNEELTNLQNKLNVTLDELNLIKTKIEELINKLK